MWSWSHLAGVGEHPICTGCGRARSRINNMWCLIFNVGSRLRKVRAAFAKKNALARFSYGEFVRSRASLVLDATLFQENDLLESGNPDVRIRKPLAYF